MKKTARFLLALLTTLMLMMVVRAVGVTLFLVDGEALCPVLRQGDRVLVNRWSYGLRVGGTNSLFNYGRIGRQPIAVGDIVAFENPLDSARAEVFICRCAALPGDSILVDGSMVEVPGLEHCADADYYWLEAVNPGNPIDSRSLGFIPEECIIGRVSLIVYSREPGAPLWNGWRADRFLLPL